MRRHFRNDRHEGFYKLLCSEQKLRDERSKEDPLGWIKAELETMWEEVNSQRESLGKETISLAEVQRVEQLAEGHFDYTPKFALYCTELVENTP